MAYREILDANGVHWKVWDTVPSSGANVRALYASGWLTFESEIERRRISPIPERWEGADETAIRGWLLNAAVIQPAQLGPMIERPAPEPAPAPDDKGDDRLSPAIRRAREVLRSVKKTLGV